MVIVTTIRHSFGMREEMELEDVADWDNFFHKSEAINGYETDIKGRLVHGNSLLRN